MIRSLFAAASAFACLVALPAQADINPSPSPQSPIEGHGATGATIDDTRFGEIGKPGPEPGAEETPPVSAGVAGSQTGLVTYAGARVDVPLSKRFSLIPQFAMLNVAPYRSGDPNTFVPYFGGGVGYRPAPTWSIEASALYGARVRDLMSVSGTLGVTKEFGADWAHDVPPPVALELALGTSYFDWANGLGPAGSTIVQGWLQGQLLWRATRRLHVTPRAMGFAYDHSLAGATGAALGSVTVLAQVGSYAPRAVFGGRVGYLIGTRVFPFVDGQEILYAEGIGNGTQLAGGLRYDIATTAHVMAMGGLLWNRVGGPLVPAAYDLSRVPVAALELELGF